MLYIENARGATEMQAQRTGLPIAINPRVYYDHDLSARARRYEVDIDHFLASIAARHNRDPEELGSLGIRVHGPGPNTYPAQVNYFGTIENTIYSPFITLRVNRLSNSFNLSRVLMHEGRHIYQEDARAPYNDPEFLKRYRRAGIALGAAAALGLWLPSVAGLLPLWVGVAASIPFGIGYRTARNPYMAAWITSRDEIDADLFSYLEVFRAMPVRRAAAG